MVSRGDAAAPGEPNGSSKRPFRLAHVLALVVGALGLLCSVALPFAGVWNDRTEVHWPSARTPPTSTTALLAPYRPAEFSASAPCPAVRSALARHGPTTVLSTVPPGSARDGMVLRTEGGRTHLLLGQREIPLPPAADCGVTVHADARGSQVRAGESAPIPLPGIAAPEIHAFTTDLAPQQAGQLSVTARTFSWFDTSPTPAKSALITGSALLALGSLVLLWTLARPSRHEMADALLLPRSAASVAALRIDAVVVAVLLIWTVIGPLTDDDGFAMRTILNYGPSGDIGNYYRWFNASETPFTLVQQLMDWWSGFGQAPVFLRLPSIGAGLLTWLAISRGIVGPLCRGTRKVPLHGLAAVAFLACWLPFGVGIRPEPFVAFGLSAVVAALLAATSPSSRAPFFWLGCAAAATGLTLAVTPTGVAALFAVLVFAPRILRLLRAPAACSPRLAIPARVALLACAGSVGLVPMFADSTLHGVQQANEIHNVFGPSLGWYQELARYDALLGTSSWGAAGKRIAVFLVLTALIGAAVCALRGLHRATRMSDAPVLIGSVAGVFAALWLTPSKWTHHFGALAGIGAALLAVTVVQLARVGRLSWAGREARWLGIAGTLGASVAAGISFTGPNRWWRYSDLAIPWSDTPVRPAGIPLDSPVLWIVVGAATGAAVLAVITSRRRRGLPTWWPSAAWTTAPASVLSLAALVSVLVLLGSFVSAPVQLGDRFSVAHANARSVFGSSCGLEDEVETLPAAPNGALRPAGDPPALDGFAAAALPSAPPEEPKPDPTSPGGITPAAASPLQWSSLTGGEAATGSMRTGWFDLPPLRDDQVLSVWVSGRPQDGNELRAEFGTGRGHRTRPVAAREMRDPPPTELPYKDPKHQRPLHWRDFRSWRLLTIPARELPAGANRVRLAATDRTTDEQGYLSLSGPVVRDVVPLRTVLAQQEPALIDWPINFLFPCHAGYPKVGHGTAESPALLITPPEGEGSMAFDPQVGGVFAGALESSRRIELPSRVRGEPGVPWGHVDFVRYDAERDAYDTREHRVRISGSEGDPPYPFKIH